MKCLRQTYDLHEIVCNSFHIILFDNIRDDRLTVYVK